MDFINDKYSYTTRDNRTIKATDIINLDVVTEITFDDLNMYKQLFELFFEEYKTYLEKIIEIDCYNSDIYKVFHSIKGSSASLGLYTISCYAKYIMDLFSDKNFYNLNKDKIIDEMISLSEITKKEFEKISINKKV